MAIGYWLNNSSNPREGRTEALSIQDLRQVVESAIKARLRPFLHVQSRPYPCVPPAFFFTIGTLPTCVPAFLKRDDPPPVRFREFACFVFFPEIVDVGSSLNCRLVCGRKTSSRARHGKSTPPTRPFDRARRADQFPCFLK